MKVKFLQHFGGVETQEVHYERGHVVELDQGVAEDLIARGICELADTQPEATPAPVPQPKKRVVTKRARRKA